MKKTIGIHLILYSLLLAGLSYVAYRLAPEAARLTLITCLAGAGLCCLWGLRAASGRMGKALPLLTLLPMTFVLLSQTVVSWSERSGELEAGMTVAAVTTLLLLLSIAMLLRIAWSGVVFDVTPATPANPKPKADVSRKPGELNSGVGQARA